MSDKTPRMVPLYHTGGTVTGRFPRPPEESPFERLARRENMAHIKVMSPPLASIDYGQIEKRILAQLATKALREMQQDIDEEGCGAVFAAIKGWGYGR